MPMSPGSSAACWSQPVKFGLGFARKGLWGVLDGFDLATGEKPSKIQ
jgi:hypothetical protein